MFNKITTTLFAAALLIGAANANATTDKLMLVGDATWGGWSYDNSALMIQNATTPTTFVYTGWLEAGKDFKFLCQAAWKSDTNDGEYVRKSATGVISAVDTLVQNGTDNHFQVAESGNYTVTADLANLTVTAVKAAYQEKAIKHNILFLVGSATPGGWTLANATPLTIADASKPFVFSASIVALAAGTFKIAINKYAGFGQQMYYCVTTDSTKLTSDSSLGDNQWRITEAGDYDITVDLENSSISIAKHVTGVAKVAQGSVKVFMASPRTIAVKGAEGQAVNVYSATGQIVKTIKVASANEAIDMSVLTSGLYIVRVGNFAQKVVTE
ncbi:MAG: SusF/SusE family outer membrane protein [Muribaculaceae bacterium]|jgi:hypothetical protein|nr:SusF/SusE family outer membrane protein [Muribaculaceae bacterium]